MAKTLQTALHAQMRDIYFAEKKLLEALPKLAGAADSEDLAAAIREHRTETEGQIDRLDQAFRALDLAPRGETCEAMKGLIEEGEEIVSENDSGPTRDALIIAACQKVEHYEIATYGTLCTWANMLGHEEVHRLLSETLDQERSADEKLTKLASTINEAAASAG